MVIYRTSVTSAVPALNYKKLKSKALLFLQSKKDG